MTILTSPISPETAERAQVRDRLHDEMWEKAMIIVDESLRAYEKGEITFEHLLHYAGRALRFVPNDFDRHRLAVLGHTVERAQAMFPGPKGRGNKGEPRWIRETARRLVELVRQRERLPVNHICATKRSVPSAYERVAEILQSAGISVSSHQVKKWHTKRADDNR